MKETEVKGNTFMLQIRIYKKLEFCVLWMEITMREIMELTRIKEKSQEVVVNKLAIYQGSWRKSQKARKPL